MKRSPENVFLHNLDQEQAAQPLWSYFLLAALLLLPLDVAVRRLVITQSDLERLRARFRRSADVTEERSERLGRLMDAKGRARSTRRPGDTDTSTDDAPPAPRRSRSTSTPRPNAPRRRSYEQSVPKEKPTREGSLASQLLERRRAEREERDDS